MLTMEYSGHRIITELYGTLVAKASDGKEQQVADLEARTFLYELMTRLNNGESVTIQPDQGEIELSRKIYQTVENLLKNEDRETMEAEKQ